MEGLSRESDELASQSKSLAISMNQEKMKVEDLEIEKRGVLGAILPDILADQEVKATTECPRSRIGSWRKMEVIWKKPLLGTQ